MGTDFIVNFSTNKVKALDVLESVEQYFEEDKPYDTVYTYIKQTISWGISELKGKCCVGEEEFYPVAHHLRIIGRDTVKHSDGDTDGDTNDSEVKIGTLIKAYRVMTIANGEFIIIKFGERKNKERKSREEHVIVFYKLQNNSTFLYASSGSVNNKFMSYIVNLFDIFEDLSIRGQ